MRYLLLILLFVSCQDAVIPKQLPEVNLMVEWIPPKSFILAGETFEPCDRGFIVSGRQDSKIGDPDAIVLPYDIHGVGRFTREITLTAGAKVYIKAWATRGKQEYTNYSKEYSFETW